VSGIAGIYNLDGRPVDPSLLTKMTDAIAHRGPDGEGHWMDGQIGMGHRMLHTTPESLHEKLPMANDRGDLVITADARIDNRDELLTSLEINGRTRDETSDAELILKAYEKWGEDCPARLLGDFAFAIWDGRERRLFCARDPIGIKPFYYHVDRNRKRFLCASEPRQIFQDPSVSRQPNLSFIGRYLLNESPEQEETLYMGVTRLPPAHSLTCIGEKIQKRQYWDVDPSKEFRYRTDEEYADHFLALFQDAVRSRLRSCGPVGAWLSGGLDSSSIVCTAQKLYQERAIEGKGFETFSILFDELPCDERRYIEAVVQKWGLRAHTFSYEKNADSVDIRKVLCYPDVLYDPTLFISEPALRSARQRGIKVILCGLGGDDLLAAGFYHLADLLRQLRIRELVAQAKRDAVTYEKRALDLLVNDALRPLLPQPVKLGLRALLKPLRGTGIPAHVNPDFFKKFCLKDHTRKRAPQRKFPTLSQEEIYTCLRYEWNTNVVVPTIDLFNARFSLETRYPFFDRRLVEYLMGIPEDQRWRGDLPKTVLRNAMQGILPDAIQQRKTKADFTMLYDMELRGRQREKVGEVIHNLALAPLGIVNDQSVRDMFEAYCRGNSSHRASLSVILGLELWCRTELNGELRHGKAQGRGPRSDGPKE